MKVMPEDQGVQGDRWTEEACRLLDRIGWEKVADCNIDIPGSDGEMHGIDALFKYTDGFQPNRPQGVFLEAKCYKTSSFSATKLKDWVHCFDSKIRELRMSEKFYSEYPSMADTNPINGLLAVWFADCEKYQNFRKVFKKALLSCKCPRKHRSESSMNRLFVIENDGILRLSALMNSIDNFNRNTSVN
jgi:hypothetical protein